jgi:YVTN family beta-propeller protein
VNKFGKNLFLSPNFFKFFMKNIQFWAMAIALLVVVSSCDPDRNVAQAYESGVFITHEGAFSGGTGTVSFYDRTVGGIKNDIYGTENVGASIGNILQSMSVVNGKAYLMVNNANRIVVADAGTFKFQDTIGGTTLPRYLLNIDDKKAFVSEWGALGVVGAVKVLDLATKKFTKTIATGKGAERLLRVGTAVWVANGGGFGSDSTVAIIDVTSEAVTSKITVGVGPNSLVQDANGDVWVLCGGTYGKTNAKLVQIKNNSIAASFNVPQGASSLATNNTKNSLFFIANNAVYQKDLTATAPSVWLDKSTTSVTFATLYGFGIDPKSGNFFCADAKDFAKSGMVYVFNSTKVVQDSLKTGIIPSNFWFQ